MLLRTCHAAAPVRAFRHASRAAATKAAATPKAKAAAAPKAPAAPKAVAAAPLAFGEIKFKKENVADVMAELPEYSFYEMDQAGPYPFKECNLNRSVLINPPSAELVAPKFEFSKLENGMKIASFDKQGLTAHLGLFVHTGSRYENASNFGVSHMASLMAFRSTAHLSHLRTVKTLEQLGANSTSGCTVGREQIAYQVDVMREFAPLAIPLLIGNVLFPRLLPWEVKAEHGKVKAAQDALRTDPDAMVRELLHRAAYCNNSLGHSTLATERSVAYFTPETIRSFILDHFAPERMALVGVNVAHEELGKWAMRSFADYNAVPLKERTEAKAAYTGGDARSDGPTSFCHLAIGFESTGSSAGTEALATNAVLQTLLGEGSAASTGVGRGAGSRLSALVQQSPYVESCSAFNVPYSDSGLLGVYSVVQPAHAGEVTAAVCKALASLAKTSAEELTRAKAVLKTSAHRQADDSSALLLDMGMQLATSGGYVSASEFARAVDSVSESAVAAAAQKILASRPSVAAFGDTHMVPHYTAIEAAMKA